METQHFAYFSWSLFIYISGFLFLFSFLFLSVFTGEFFFPAYLGFLLSLIYNIFSIFLYSNVDPQSLGVHGGAHYWRQGSTGSLWFYSSLLVLGIFSQLEDTELQLGPVFSLSADTRALHGKSLSSNTYSSIQSKFNCHPHPKVWSPDGLRSLPPAPPTLHICSIPVYFCQPSSMHPINLIIAPTVTMPC